MYYDKFTVARRLNRGSRFCGPVAWCVCGQSSVEMSHGNFRLTTAVTGMRAQSLALENISGNIANSQTTGFKREDQASSI